MLEGVQDVLDDLLPAILCCEDRGPKLADDDLKVDKGKIVKKAAKSAAKSAGCSAEYAATILDTWSPEDPIVVVNASDADLDFPVSSWPTYAGYASRYTVAGRSSNLTIELFGEGNVSACRHALEV